MKKLLVLLAVSSSIALTGCFEIIQETNINDNETGVFKNTTDLSTMMGMLKMMGGEEDLKKLGEKKDSTVSLAKYTDSIQNLTDTEKAILKRGSLHLLMNVEEEKLLVTFIFPYTDANDLSHMAGLLKKIRKQVVGSQMNALSDKGDDSKAMGETMSETTEIDEFFDIVHKKGKLVKKINKDKYATVNDDEGLKSLKEMSQMGSPMTLKTVLNLPRPAKKAEGKGVELSADKKKITITTTIDDLFEDPSKFEYEVEY
jgi:hypothetical protein